MFARRNFAAETMILPRTPDESLVVDVARGLDSGSMIEQAHRVLMHVSYSVGYHREEGNVEFYFPHNTIPHACVSLCFTMTHHGEPGAPTRP